MEPFLNWRQIPALSNPEKLFKSYKSLSSAINSGLVKTAHDCSEGGLGVTLAEMCIGGRIGASIDLDGTGTAPFGPGWGESLGRIVVAVSQENEQKFLDKMTGSKTTFLGTVDDTDALTITDGFESVISTVKICSVVAEDTGYDRVIFDVCSKSSSSIWLWDKLRS